MKSIYSFFEKGFVKYLHEKNGTQIKKENLKFAFFDLKGLSYYKFTKDLALPMVRLGKLHEYMKWLSAGVTGSELDDMLDNADKALTDGIKNGKNASKIGFVISELRDRKKMVVNDELFYNIIAVQMVRSDESPTEFNNEIQLQKVQALRLLNESNDTFFLNISEYLRALNWSNITREELMDILQNSEIYRRLAQEQITKVFEK